MLTSHRLHGHGGLRARLGGLPQTPPCRNVLQAKAAVCRGAQVCEHGLWAAEKRRSSVAIWPAPRWGDAFLLFPTARCAGRFGLEVRVYSDGIPLASTIVHPQRSLSFTFTS